MVLQQDQVREERIIIFLKWQRYDYYDIYVIYILEQIFTVKHSNSRFSTLLCITLQTELVPQLVIVPCIQKSLLNT